MVTINYALVKKLPKVELHCHLDGCLRPESILEVAKKDKVELPSNQIDELSSYLKIGKKRGSLEDYIKRFDITLSVMQTPESLTRFAFELIEDVAKEMQEFGELTGHKKQANKKAKQFLSALEVIKKQYQSKTKVVAFYELWSRPLTTVAKGSWPQQFLSVCGVENPFKQVAPPYPQVNIEKILQTPIQLIIQPLSTNQTDKQGFNWRDWPVIPAVKNQQIIQPDADAMHRMTARSIRELKNLCTSIDETRQWLLNNNAL